MKKVLLIMAVALLSVTATQAQGQFRAGLSGGLPIGDAGDLATFSIAVDLGYLFEISDSFDVGATTGYSHSFGDSVDSGFGTIEIEDVQFIPIAAAARVEVAPSFILGGDVGYALGVNDGNDGGFYYAPRAQYGVSDAIDIVVAFRGVAVDGGSWDIVTAGVEFGID